MKNFLLLLGLTVPLFSAAQECVQLTRDVKTMGLTQRSDVNLEDMDPVTLPVVFHIVHKGEGDVTNISDEQVLSQIPALDTGFRWGPGVDTKIQFCIASRDPDGNPTNGITRHNGVQLFGSVYEEEGITSSSMFEGVNDNLLKSTVGCWNPDEYINFYVVSEIQGNNGGGGVQGYAYVGGYANGPNGGCGDGIVQLYNVTGTTGTLKSGKEQGETAVHEMGHHLDLWHTFQFGNCNETNCETQGDQVCDTPPTTANNACDPSFGDCSIPPMTENFMDYTSEQCRETFTVGQAERMWEHLLSEKQQLIDSYACISPVDYDLAISDAFYQETWCEDFQDIWVTVVNQGAQQIPIAEVQLLCNGEQYNETVFDLGDGAGVSVLFEQVFVDEAQMFEAQVISSLDQYEFNDNAWWPIETLDGDLLRIDVHKDFWGCMNFQFFDTDGEIMVEEYYSAGEQTYTYEVCVYEGCYTVAAQDCAGDGFCTFGIDENGNCQYGSEGIVGTIGQDTVFATGYGLQFYEWELEWCNTLPACAYDLDANGSIGNGDVVVLLSNYGCVGDCEGDLNGDGIVSVLDLLEILTSVGDCPVEQDFSIGTYKDLVVRGDTGGLLGGGQPKIYDLTGRRLRGPLEQLATGFYILKWHNQTKKVFVQ
jgi:hypothetical protein|tara:strand:+ start:2810 stop:4753 length:1944 start_codon:yes stop_codon:yes gene_type:complete